MSLVNYDASSSDEDEQPMDVDFVKTQKSIQGESLTASPSTVPVLPNPAELLQQATTTGTLSRKRSRDSSIGIIEPLKKIPHGRLPSIRIPPDTANGQLIPPQLLLRRKNISTEDTDKLFVRRNK